jgi:hypothetical protein
MVSVNLGSPPGARRGVPPAGTVRRRLRTLALRDLEAEARARRRRGLPVLNDGADDDVAGGVADGVDLSTSRLPASRSACRGGARPCPLVSCRYHLYLDVDPRNGSLKLNFPDLEPWDLPCSCALDVAEDGGVTLDVVGEHLGLTRERARQIELLALGRLHDGLADPKTTTR